MHFSEIKLNSYRRRTHFIFIMSLDASFIGYKFHDFLCTVFFYELLKFQEEFLTIVLFLFKFENAVKFTFTNCLFIIFVIYFWLEDIFRMIYFSLI